MKKGKIPSGAVFLVESIVGAGSAPFGLDFLRRHSGQFQSIQTAVVAIMIGFYLNLKEFKRSIEPSSPALIAGNRG